jgi:hypothetical protein
MMIKPIPPSRHAPLAQSAARESDAIAYIMLKPALFVSITATFKSHYTPSGFSVRSDVPRKIKTISFYDIITADKILLTSA